MKRKALFIIAAIALFWQVSSAQTTGFSYQGSLKNAGAPASGNHDFEFRLWDAATSGAQIGTTITLNGVAVTNGIFSVTLDFGDQYPNANRFLEVRVRPTGGGAFTTLTPREQIKAVPYAVKSLNAEQLGGVAANQYVTTTTGGANFIQNTTTQQASSNFNIDGNGIVAGRLGIGTQFPAYKLHVEHGGGAGGSGILIKSTSGFSTLDIDANSSDAAIRFFEIGVLNWVIRNNPGTHDLQIFEGGAGERMRINNDTGNVVIGGGASTSAKLTVQGGTNVSGNLDIGGNGIINGNLGIGVNPPLFKLDVLDPSNTGLRVQTNTPGGTVASFGGLGSFNIDASSLAGGRFTVLETGKVGIGISAPAYKLHVVGENIRVEGDSTFVLPRFSLNFTGGGINEKKWQNYASPNGLNFTALNDAENAETRWLRVNRGTGTAISSVQFENGFVVINNLGAAGATALCRNTSNEISTCSSSARYKKDVASYKPGLSLIKQLRPVSFNWKSGGMADLGLVAEEVADIEPLLTTTNVKGEVEGVKYDRIGVIAVNAIKEQQAEISGQRSVISGQQRQIEDLNSKVKDQQKQIDALKKLVCAQNPTAEICMEEK